MWKQKSVELVGSIYAEEKMIYNMYIVSHVVDSNETIKKN